MLLPIDHEDMHKILFLVFLVTPWCCRPCPRQDFPASLLSAWAASEHWDGVTQDFLSHHSVGWALPVLCKEGFALKSLLAHVLLSKHVAGHCFVAVLLCWISSFLALCVRVVVDG